MNTTSYPHISLQSSRAIFPSNSSYVMMFVRATFERKADVAEEDMKMIQSLTAAMDED